MNKKMRIAICAATISAVLLTGCESWGRFEKSLSSDLGGGLHRTVTAYSNTGEKLGEWSGKFDVSESENEIFFDIDGRRVIIHGGIAINEETAGQEEK